MLRLRRRGNGEASFPIRALGCKRLLSLLLIEGEFPVCGFACLLQHDDTALAKRMIRKVEHPGGGLLLAKLRKHYTKRGVPFRCCFMGSSE